MIVTFRTLISTIRKYTARDRKKCLTVFNSNTPAIFAEDERPLFDVWVRAPENGTLAPPNSSLGKYS